MNRPFYRAFIVSLKIASLTGVADAQAWIPLGRGMSGFAEYPSYVFTIVGDGDTLYAGGYFTAAGGVAAHSIAKWDGTSWSPVGSGLSEFGMYSFSYHINSLAIYHNQLYAGGEFDSMGGVPARGLARWYGSGWSIAVAEWEHFEVNAMAVFHDELYVTGVFDSVQGVPAGGIAKWNGAYWGPVGSAGPHRGGTAMLACDSALYVAGSNAVRKWNGVDWSDMNTGFPTDHPVSSLAFYNGKLYLSTAATYPANTILEWDDSTWTPIVLPRTNLFYSGLAAYHGLLYAGGSPGGFDSSGVPNGIAAWNGSQWSGIDGGEVGGILTLAVFQDELYAGGSFVVAGGDSVFNIAKLSAPTDVFELPSGNARGYRLFQNYPNPFNSTTQIGFQIPRSQFVTLKVFNLLGQEMTTLVNAYLSPGMYLKSWDGSGAATGVYFYRLQTRDLAESKRILLIR